MPIRLRPHVSVAVREDSIVVATEQSSYRLRTTSPAILALAQKLGDSGSTIALTPASKSDEATQPFLKFLIDHDLTYQDDRHSISATSAQYERQHLYLATVTNSPTSAQTALERSSVAIIGIGGTGAVVLQHLVGAGVKRFVLVDNDTVDITNLNRQFIYRKRDVGSPKVKIAASYIHDRIDNAIVDTYSDRLGNDFPPSQLLDAASYCDLFVIAFDTPTHSGPSEFLTACWTQRRAAIFGAVGADAGFVTPVFSPNHGSLTCYSAPDNFSSTRHAPPTFSFGPVNTAIGAEIARKSILHLAGVASPSTYSQFTVHRFHDRPTVTHSNDITWAV